MRNSKPDHKKDPAAVSLGRRGGKARAKTLTSEHQSETSRARWGERKRCACGAMTAARAEKRGHKCGNPVIAANLKLS